jgi:hypothetical protein
MKKAERYFQKLIPNNMKQATMTERDFNTELGATVVLMVTGDTRKFIAEVTQEDPLRFKVEEEGPYSNLKAEDFIISRVDTIKWQSGQDSATKMLKEAKERGFPYYSGLKSLGVETGKLHEILPDNKERILDIIKIGQYILAVDKKAEIKQNDKFIIDVYNSNQYGIKTAEVIGYDIIRQKEDFAQVLPFDKNLCVKIIAHLPLNGAKPLEGVYKLPELEDIKIKGQQWYIDKHPGCKINERSINGFIAGYKAAGGYTEEDIKNAYNRGFTAGEEHEEQNAEEYLLSLKPFPRAFELVSIDETRVDENDTLIGSYIYD